MSKIAIDIVLIPPEDLMDKAIEINSQLIDDPIKLNKDNCLPHVSLCMGVIQKENLPKINQVLDEIARQSFKIPLTIDKIDIRHVCFNIKNNENLQKLHEAVMTRLESYLSYDASVDMCYSPPPVVEKTLSWINNYKEKSSFDNFHPHITLGVTKVKEAELNINFAASRLAICHLGNYCTCRKLLHSVSLL